MNEDTQILPEPVEPVEPEPTKRSGGGTGKVLIAGIIVLALVLGGAVAAVFAFSGGSHEIETPATAGGMKRDTAREKQLRSQLDSAEEQFKTQQAKGAKYVRSAVYSQDDADRGPKGPLVFLGARLAEERDPQKFLDTFKKNAEANGFKVAATEPGDGGGQASCAQQTLNGSKVAICVWATEDSIGELIPAVAGYEAKTLSELMRALREDVES